MPVLNTLRRFSNSCFYGLVLVLVASALVWLWSFSPMAEKINFDLLLTAADVLRNSRFTHLLLFLAYILASLIVFPFSILDIFTMAVFGPVQGAVYAYMLSFVCALGMFILVRYFRRKPIIYRSKILPVQFANVLNQPGIVEMAIARNLPIAFSVNNIIFSLSSITLRDFLIGTLIGNLFPIFFLAVIFSQTQQALLNPGFWQISCLGLALAAAFTLYRLFRKWIRGKGISEHNTIDSQDL